jgi:1-acyl-sn-glycerol-3-phosphate acyltransferase
MSEPLAPMKAQVYRDPRPAGYFDRFHERARTREPDWVYDLARLLCSPLAWILFRARCIASENVPATGPVILAPNHFSFMDHFFLGVFLRRRIRFMGKSQLFTPPMQFIYTHGGVFPVRRGHHDEEAFVTADIILEQGGCIGMYCEGGRSRSGNVSETARPGLGRLALASGAPVVPVAIHGSQKARNWRRGQFPRVTVQYGEPVVYPRNESAGREQWQAVADDVLGRIRRLHAALDEHGRRTIAQRAREQRRAARGGPAPA